MNAGSQAVQAKTYDLKPMVRARRVSLFQRDVLISLSAAAIEILLEGAAVLSEGQFEGQRYFGSTMVTVDVAKASRRVIDGCEERVVRKVAELCQKDKRLRTRLKQIARAEAHRLAGDNVVKLQIDVQVRFRGSHVHLDLDVEGSKKK